MNKITQVLKTDFGISTHSALTDDEAAQIVFSEKVIDIVIFAAGVEESSFTRLSELISKKRTGTPVEKVDVPTDLQRAVTTAFNIAF